MPTQKINLSSTEPVFIMSRYLPDNVDVISMCRAAEAVSGAGSVKGAFGDGGLWRVYPKTDVARALLLSKGFTVHRQRVQPEAVNPFIMKGSDTETPATRLTVGPLAFSYSDEFITRNLEALGFRLRSKLVMENERENRAMTDWANGKRFVWIDLPKSPSKEFVEMGPLKKVKLFYREMREQRMKCYNCQQYGHKAADCSHEPVCYACGEVGHKKGDTSCKHWEGSGLGQRDSSDDSDNDDENNDDHDNDNDNSDDNNDDNSDDNDDEEDVEEEEKDDEDDESDDDGNDDCDGEDEEDDDDDDVVDNNDHNDDNKDDNNDDMIIEGESVLANSLGEGEGAEGEEGVDLERYVITDSNVKFDEDLSPERKKNSTFTFSPRQETDSGALANPISVKPSFPEYNLSEDEAAPVSSEEPKAQRSVRKVKKTYAEAVSGNDSSDDEGEEKTQKVVRKKGKKSEGEMRGCKLKSFSQASITQFTEAAVELKKKRVLLTSPDGEFKGKKGKAAKK